MRTCAQQNRVYLLSVQPIDQKPVGHDAAFTAAAVLAFQKMIAIFDGQRQTIGDLLHHGKQLIPVFPLLFAEAQSYKKSALNGAARSSPGCSAL